MTQLSLALALVVASATPRATVEVLTDAATATPLSWPDDCGPLPEPTRLPKGTQLQIVDVGAEWRLQIGAEAIFGTDVCSGINPTLQLMTQRREGDEWFVSCKSQRVVKATETTETYLRKKAQGRIELDAKITRRIRKGRSSCDVVLERQTLFMPPHVDDEPEEPEPIAAAPEPTPTAEEDIVDDVLDEAPAVEVAAVAHVVQKPLSSGERAQIESEINKAVKRVARRGDVAPLKILHENQMSDEFIVIERHYMLDGTVLGEEDGRQWGVLQRRALHEVFDDVLPVGVHVLEVEFVYKTDEGAKLRLKDAVFFDVDQGKPQRLKIASVESGHFFTPVSQKPKITFEINGKPYQR